MAKPDHDGASTPARNHSDHGPGTDSRNAELEIISDELRTGAVVDPADEIESAALAPGETIGDIWRDYELIVRNEDALYVGALTDADALRQSTTNQAREAFTAACSEADQLYAHAADTAEHARRAAVAAARTTRDRRIDDVLHAIGPVIIGTPWYQSMAASDES
jgi:hypothetical protein